MKGTEVYPPRLPASGPLDIRQPLHLLSHPIQLHISLVCITTPNLNAILAHHAHLSEFDHASQVGRLGFKCYSNKQ